MLIEGSITNLKDDRILGIWRRNVKATYMQTKRSVSRVNYGGCASSKYMCNKSLYKDSPLNLSLRFNKIEKVEGEELRDLKLVFHRANVTQAVFYFKSLPITWK